MAPIAPRSTGRYTPLSSSVGACIGPSSSPLHAGTIVAKERVRREQRNRRTVGSSTCGDSDQDDHYPDRSDPRGLHCPRGSIAHDSRHFMALTSTARRLRELSISATDADEQELSCPRAPLSESPRPRCSPFSLPARRRRSIRSGPRARAICLDPPQAPHDWLQSRRRRRRRRQRLDRRPGAPRSERRLRHRQLSRRRPPPSLRHRTDRRGVRRRLASPRE